MPKPIREGRGASAPLPTEKHPRAEQGYRYADHADLIGGKVMNADYDAVYVQTADGRTFIIALNGQSNPFIEYGVREQS